MAWNIIYFEAGKNKPIEEFIEALPPKAQAKVVRALELLEEYGTRLGMPHVKKLSGLPLWELRILGKDNVRIFYIACSNKDFLLLHGFIKKSQKTSQKEINTALKRFDIYQK